MPVKREWMLLALLLTAPMTAAAGNVITDWDEKAISLVQTGTVPPPPTANRALAILHIAMFDAVNSIEPRYKPYKIRLPATPDTSKEAAAAAAAEAGAGRFGSGCRRKRPVQFDELSRDLA